MRFTKRKVRFSLLGFFALAALGIGLAGAFMGGSPPVARADSICTNGTVIPRPDDNPDLVHDCEVLLYVKAALGITVNWNGETAIKTWDGVTVSGSPERVTVLFLKNRRGTGGVIPPELGLLSELHSLTLRRVPGLEGTIPPELGHLSKLRTLNISQNSVLTGEIPEELGHLTELRTVWMYSNNLTGTVPSVFGNLEHLRTLHIANNNLTGCLHQDVAAITSNDFTKAKLAACTGDPEDIPEPPALGTLALPTVVYDTWNDLGAGPWHLKIGSDINFVINVPEGMVLDISFFVGVSEDDVDHGFVFMADDGDALVVGGSDGAFWYVKSGDTIITDLADTAPQATGESEPSNLELFTMMADSARNAPEAE